MCPIFAGSEVDSVTAVSSEFFNVSKWATENGFTSNIMKTKAINTVKKGNNFDCKLPFDVVEEIKILGVFWRNDLKWLRHFKDVELRCSRRLYVLRVLRNTLQHCELWTVFTAVIECLLLYASPLFGILSADCYTIVKKLFRRAKKIICYATCNCENTFDNFLMRRKRLFVQFYQNCHCIDHPLYDVIPQMKNGRVIVPMCQTKRRQNCFVVLATRLVNHFVDLI